MKSPRSITFRAITCAVLLLTMALGQEPMNPAARLPKSAAEKTRSAEKTDVTKKQDAIIPQEPVPYGSQVLTPKENALQAIAEKFAPVIYQRMAGTAEEHRYDFPTNFDFDGDWTGNNNWEHAADTKFKIHSHVYYAVIESEDHWFIYYALYHMRDWATGEKYYEDILDKVQKKYKDILDEPLREGMEFNHENDMEGVLLIVEKDTRRPGEGNVVGMETVAHESMLRAVDEDHVSWMRSWPKKMKRELMQKENDHPLVYVESQKHGIHPYSDQRGNVSLPILQMRIGSSVEFTNVKDNTATYDLIPLRTKLWTRARGTQEPNAMYGTVIKFDDKFCQIQGASSPSCNLGTMGAAFFGQHDRVNAALAPWAWEDKWDRSLEAGTWFLDPLAILRNHFGQPTVDERYVYHPFLGIQQKSKKGRN